MFENSGVEANSSLYPTFTYFSVLPTQEGSLGATIIRSSAQVQGRRHEIQSPEIPPSSG